jgi:hypothetical protein
MGVGTFKGRAAIRGFLEDWLGSYEDYEIELGPRKRPGSYSGRSGEFRRPRRGRPAL